jgi:hypothetical protein
MLRRSRLPVRQQARLTTNVACDFFARLFYRHESVTF